MRTLVIAAALSAFIPAAAASQQNPPPQGAVPSPVQPAPRQAETTGAAARAPAGHRQPNAQSLPPAVRRDENGNGSRVADPLGPLPRLCRDC